MSADLRLTVAWFETAMPTGLPAYGEPETLAWTDLVSIISDWRREGDKDGIGFVPARLRLEPDGRLVRRRRINVVARTAVALDIELNKVTGEVPPPFDDTSARVQALGLAGVLYTSHNHAPDNLRYRVVVPLYREIAPDLPAPEVLADQLGVLGVLDTSKIHAEALFYLPSAPLDRLEIHAERAVPGTPLDAAWVEDTAGALLAVRQAEADRIAAEANEAAAARRAAKLAAGFDPADSLIEKIRAHLDLDSVLTSHGYAKLAGKYRHPNSSSGSYGASVKTFGGIERVFSHNGTDPLHASNLPAWCGGVTAIDAVDAVIILDFGSDRTRALAELATRFNLTKTEANKTVAGIIFRKIRSGASQKETEAAAFTAGYLHGLSREEVCAVARWAVQQPPRGRAA